MNDIHIFDVYGYLHTVSTIEKYNRAEKRCMPVGGMHFLLRKISAELLIGNKVVCCFDSKAPKNSRMPGYKRNRKLIPEIIAQAEYLHNMLLKCGIPCYRGFAEADDFIFNICEQYVPTLEYTNIYINACDYDLCHNVMCRYDNKGEVQLKTINTNCCDVNWNNFSVVLFDKKTKEKVIYNTISAYKVFCGDTSDSIKTFTLSDGTKGIDLYRGYKNFLFEKGLISRGYEVTRDRKILEFYINKVLGVTNLDDLHRLTQRMNTIYPRDLKASYPDGFKVVGKSEVNLQQLTDYCYVIGDQSSLGSLRKMGKIPHDKESNEIRCLEDELFKFGTDFSNGAFMADNNLPMASMVSSAEQINIFKEF